MENTFSLDNIARDIDLRDICDMEVRQYLLACAIYRGMIYL